MKNDFGRGKDGARLTTSEEEEGADCVCRSMPLQFRRSDGGRPCHLPFSLIFTSLTVKIGYGDTFAFPISEKHCTVTVSGYTAENYNFAEFTGQEEV